MLFLRPGRKVRLADVCPVDARAPSLCVWTLLLLLAMPARADIEISGDRLTLTTANFIAYFRGPDLIRLTNRLTNEQHVRQASPIASMLEMSMLEPTGKPMRWTDWRQGKVESANPDAAMISLNDLTRSVWMSVIVDPETQDIVITLWGEANREGVTGLTWGIRGLDLSSGRLILPAQGGCYVDQASAPTSLTLAYPTEWEAQMAVWEGRNGGFVVYSRDDRPRFKRLRLTRRGDYLDLGLETEAVAPWARAGGVPQLEWRINAFRGDWSVPASGYRNLMHFLRKPVEARGERAWINDIRRVVTLDDHQFDPARLDSLARQAVPRETLLYLPHWQRRRANASDSEPSPRDGVRTFIDRARQLGFRVMLPLNLSGLAPAHPAYPRLRPYQVRDARNGKHEIKNADASLVYINPAARAYRSLCLARLRTVVEDLRADAVHLDASGVMWNDGNGLLEEKNYAQGMVALYRAMLQTFPEIALGGESVNEVISPYLWFAPKPKARALPPHPISAFLFGDHVLYYDRPEAPEPGAVSTGATAP